MTTEVCYPESLGRKKPVLFPSVISLTLQHPLSAIDVVLLVYCELGLWLFKSRVRIDVAQIDNWHQTWSLFSSHVLNLVVMYAVTL